MCVYIYIHTYIYIYTCIALWHITVSRTTCFVTQEGMVMYVCVCVCVCIHALRYDTTQTQERLVLQHRRVWLCSIALWHTVESQTPKNDLSCTQRGTLIYACYACTYMHRVMAHKQTSKNNLLYISKSTSMHACVCTHAWVVARVHARGLWHVYTRVGCGTFTHAWIVAHDNLKKQSVYFCTKACQQQYDMHIDISIPLCMYVYLCMYIYIHTC